MGGSGEHFEFEWEYDARGTLGPSETRPIMMMWMAPQTRYAVHRRRLVPAEGLWRKGGPPFARVRVRFPHDPSRPLEHDTSVHAILLSTVESSEGKLTYEKAASTRFYLADLLASHEEEGRAGAAPKRAGARWAREPMRVQSYYMPPPGHDRPELVDAERHKGDLRLRLVRAPRSASGAGLRLPWAKPSGFELTPANVPALQRAMMSSVNRTMAPFRPGAGAEGLAPTEREILNVHAPLYVQETQVPVDGAAFWSRAPVVAKEHVSYEGGAKEGERYLELLLQQSMARHNVTAAEFLHAAASFDERVAPHARAAGPPGGRRRDDEGDDEAHDAAVHRAAAVVGTAMTMRGNMMKYVSDRVVLARTGAQPVVESFDQADVRTANARDAGGVRSRVLLGPAAAAARFRGAHGRGVGGEEGEDDRNVASGGAIDCEDAGRDAAVHFALLSDPGAGIPDEGLTRPLVVAGRAVAQHYRAMGVLCSVLSRNLADARGHSGAAAAPPPPPRARPFAPAGAPIGSPDDERVDVGAHMFLLLVPDTTVRASVVRALDAPARLSRTRPKVDLGVPDPERVRGTPLRSGRELPVVLCEGTGVLNPLMRPSEAYESTRAGRVRAALADVVRQEGVVRLVTAQSSVEIAERIADRHPRVALVRSAWGGEAIAEGGGAPPPEALGKFQEMHRQQEVVDHPDLRLIKTFYRTGAEFYLVPPMAQVEARLRASKRAPVRARRRRQRSGEGALLAGDRLIPVQTRPRHQETPAVAASRPGHTWGVAVSDVIRQREFVGLLPTPAPTPAEAGIVDRVHRHLAPTVPLRRDLDPHSDRYIREASRWPALFAAASRLPPITDAHRDLAVRGSPERYALVHKYADPRELSRREVAEIARWMGTANGRFVKAAGLSLERTTERLATVRLSALVDCGDTADRVRGQIEALF